MFIDQTLVKIVLNLIYHLMVGHSNLARKIWKTSFQALAQFSVASLRLVKESPAGTVAVARSSTISRNREKAPIFYSPPIPNPAFPSKSAFDRWLLL